MGRAYRRVCPGPGRTRAGALAGRRLGAGLLAALVGGLGCGLFESDDGGDGEGGGAASAGGAPGTGATSGIGGAVPAAPGLRDTPLVYDTDAVFDPTVIRRVDVTIPTDNGPPSSWDSINEEAPTDGCVATTRNYYSGSVSFDGQSRDDVGVRVKGGCGSWRYLEEKPSLKISLRWDSDPTTACPADRSISGRRTLTLNNGVQDPTALHEHLTYQFYRLVGIPAPLTASVQVFINGEYYGVYQLVESIDRPFLKRWFVTEYGKGMMYEGSYFCDFVTGEDSQQADGSCWQREFELDDCDNTPAPEDDLQVLETDGNPQDPWWFLAGLTAYVQRVQGASDYYPAIEAAFDMDAYVTYWAATSILADWDSYPHWQNNFRLYHDPGTNLWFFIPWGTDQTWEHVDVTVAEAGGGTPGDWGQWGGGEFEFGLFDPAGDVARLCLRATGTDEQGRTCEQRYVTELYRQASVLESVDWGAEIDAWQARLDPAMAADDPHRDYRYAEWEASVAELRAWAVARAQQVREELAEAGYSAP